MRSTDQPSSTLSKAVIWLFLNHATFLGVILFAICFLILFNVVCNFCGVYSQTPFLSFSSSTYAFVSHIFNKFFCYFCLVNQALYLSLGVTSAKSNLPNCAYHNLFLRSSFLFIVFFFCFVCCLCLSCNITWSKHARYSRDTLYKVLVLFLISVIFQ